MVAMTYLSVQDNKLSNSLIEKNGAKSTIAANVLLFVIVSLFAVAAFFPEKFWGFNHLAFLPDSFRALAILLLGISFLPLFIEKSVRFNISFFSGIPRNQKLMLFALFSVLFGQLYDLLPIYYDIYGDAFDIGKGPGYQVTELNQDVISELTRLDFGDSKIGERTTFLVTYLMSYFFEISNLEAFEWLGKICGMIWVFSWLQFCDEMLRGRTLKLIAILLGILAPFSQIFYHHYEIYALGITMMLVITVQSVFYLKYKEGWRLLVLGVLVMLALFTHVLFLLWIPALIGLVIWQFSDKFKANLSMKKALKYYLIPIHVIGVLMYMFVFNSHSKSREFNTDKLEEAVFLPITSSDSPPLDKYYLFDFAHIMDFFNVFFIWSIAGVYIIALILIKYKSRINWNQPGVVFLVSILIPYVSFFFVFNPLLGMEADWDLFSLPASIMLILAVCLMSDLTLKDFELKRLFPSVGFSILGFLFIIVNSDQESLSKRYETSGKHLFKTYYIGASTTLHGAIHLCGSDEQKHVRRSTIIESLAPYATKGNDIEYADMLCEEGLYFLRQERDKKKALTYFEEAASFAPHLKRNVLELALLYEDLGMHEEALEQSRLLILMEYPSQEEAHKRLIHYTLLNGDYSKAIVQCEEFIKKWPDSKYQFIELALNVLKSDNPVDALKLFKTP